MPGSDHFYPSVPLILCIVYAHMHLTWRCVVGTVKITSWDVNVRVVPTAFNKYNESEVLNAVHVSTVGGFWNKSVINDLDHRVNANYTVNVNTSRCCTSFNFDASGRYGDGINYWAILIIFWSMVPYIKSSKCMQNNAHKFYIMFQDILYTTLVWKRNSSHIAYTINMFELSSYIVLCKEKKKHSIKKIWWTRFKENVKLLQSDLELILFDWCTNGFKQS